MPKYRVKFFSDRAWVEKRVFGFWVRRYVVSPTIYCQTKGRYVLDVNKSKVEAQEWVYTQHPEKVLPLESTRHE